MLSSRSAAKACTTRETDARREAATGNKQPQTVSARVKTHSGGEDVDPQVTTVATHMNMVRKLGERKPFGHAKFRRAHIPLVAFNNHFR